MNKIEQHLKTILDKMGSYVGVNYDWIEEHKEEDWYSQKEWTAEQEDDFIKWLEDYMKKSSEARYLLMSLPHKAFIKKFVQSFILNYGWKTKEPFKVEVVTDVPQQIKKEPLLKVDEETGLAICPMCKKQTLVVDGGCVNCINEDCGYSKCDM